MTAEFASNAKIHTCSNYLSTLVRIPDKSPILGYKAVIFYRSYFRVSESGIELDIIIFGS